MSERIKQFDAALNAGKVTEERGKVYAAPSIDFSRAARIKAVVAECEDPLARHALEMIAVKMARLINSPFHLDSWIDIAGYARCGVAVTEPDEIAPKTGPGCFHGCNDCPDDVDCFKKGVCFNSRYKKP